MVLQGHGFTRTWFYKEKVLLSRIWAFLQTKHHPNHVGFSLLEVLVVLAMLTMLSYIAQPNLQASLTKSSLKHAHQGMLQLLSQARLWALLRRQTVIVCGWRSPCHAGSEASHFKQVLAFVDDNNDQLWQTHEPIVQRLTLRQVTVSNNRGDYVHFSGSGTTLQSGTWRFCHTADQQGLSLVLTSSGNLRSDVIVCHA